MNRETCYFAQPNGMGERTYVDARNKIVLRQGDTVFLATGPTWHGEPPAGGTVLKVGNWYTVTRIYSDYVVSLDGDGSPHHADIECIETEAENEVTAEELAQAMRSLGVQGHA